ncbi:MAG: LLM class F420-dependent oxidoreductase [Acidimicrobiia bacterium]|nr:LLM class F420-dependent oxidoreductase [Acidimicrobiia bacterium]
MQLGIFDSSSRVDRLVASAKEADELGFSTLWTPQTFDVDALTALAVVAREVPGLRLGTAVVPTYPRHPMMLAQQARTVNQVADGRLRLGIGLSHQPVVEGMWGIPFDKPIRHMREYLEILVPLLRDGKVSFGGETLTGRGEINIPGEPCGVLVAALGPRMLELTAQVADGTITWMVGPRTLAEHTTPVINAAAEAAGRPAPQVIASLPVCVTADIDTARTRAAEDFAIYGHLPSYRAMLDREGADGPEDIAAIGSIDHVAERLDGLFTAGATEAIATIFGERDEIAATREALATLL